MNCLRFTTRTGLLALVAVLLVGAMMPVVAGAANGKKEAGSFDPFDLDAMFAANLNAANVSVLAAPTTGQGTIFRVQKLIATQRSNALKLRSPFQPTNSPFLYFPLLFSTSYPETSRR